MRIFLTYFLFFVLYILGSRIIFIPAGMAMGIGKHAILAIVFALDLVQIPIFYYIYEKGTEKIKILNFLYSKLPTKESVNSSGLMKFAKSLGGFGIVLIAAMPAFGGGMWTSVLVAHLLKLEKKLSIFLLALGSLLGCLGIVYGFEGIRQLIGLWKF